MKKTPGRPKQEPDPKTSPRKRHGGGFAKAETVQDAPDGKPARASSKKRKSNQMKMKKKTEIRKQKSESRRHARLRGLPPAAMEARKELVSPDEWDALLHSFESDGATATSTRDGTTGLMLDSSDDLWEKLSSTRWLKDRQSEDVSTKSTVAQRPQ